MEVDKFTDISGLPERNVYVVIFQICAVATAINYFPRKGKGSWWYFEEAKFVDSESVFP